MRWIGRINNYGIQYLSGRINYCQLTPCTECRVPSEYKMSCDRRLHKELCQVLPKYPDSTVLCLFCQIRTDFTLNGGSYQTVVCICNHSLKQVICILIVFLYSMKLKILQDFLNRRLYLYCQELFILSTVKCKYSVSKYCAYLFRELIVVLIYTLSLFILCFGWDKAFISCKFSDIDTIIRLIRNLFSQYVTCSCYSILDSLYFLFLINEISGILCYRLFCILCPDNICQRLQSFFLSNCCSCSSLLLVGTIEVFYNHKCCGIQYLLL